jgi:flagellar hook-associated protein 1 FlgK
MDTVSEEIRTNVQQNSIMLTETMNHYYNKLVDLQDEYNESMSIVTGQINDYLTSIGDYNKQIYSYELSGQKANDLRDKRNLMLDELSELVDIEYAENTDGELQVSVGGTMLVDHINVTKIEATPTTTGVVSGQPNYYEIVLEGTTTPLGFTSGKLKALQDLRDGNTVDNFGIPKMLDELNILARSLAEEFNTVNNAGYTIPYGANASQQNVDFFEVPAGGYADITAGNFSISAALEESGYNIAASDELVDLTATNTQQANNKNALELLGLTSRTDLANVGSFEEYLNSLVVKIAVESSHSSKMDDSQYSILSNLESRRQSLSGVSVDEEMIEMIKYQHAYTAASRMITVIDESLDVLINKTGIVGR